MVFKKIVKKYKRYEQNELARRKAIKAKVTPYKLKVKADVKKTVGTVKKKLKTFNKENYLKAMGNPYGAKFPKAKKILKKVKKRKPRKIVKTTIIYAK